MKIKPIFLLVLLSISITVLGGKTVIKGTATLFANNEITFISYIDNITNQKLELGYSNIEKDGSYYFEFDTEFTKKIILKIEDKTTWFFAEPGKVYNVNLDYDAEQNKGKVYDKELSLFFSFPLPNELNQQIKKFNIKYDQFIDDNTLLFKKRDRSIEPKLKAFKLKTLKEFENVDSDFVKNYILYTFAITLNSLDVSYTSKANKNSSNTRANIYLEYLDRKPILYHHQEYINFFQDFFQGELKTLTLQLDGMDISAAINEKSSYVALSKALGKYPFLENDEFKNLFILNGLLGISKDKYFTKENIINILEQIKKDSKYPYHKIIASNIIEKITKKTFGEGSEAPSFKLANNKGELISLSDFKGKPVYINFWTNWSIPAKKEMKIMQVLHKKYKNKVHFISICADNDVNKLTQFLNKNEDYSWDFLHIGKDKKLLDKYKIITFPTYILLDKNLKVAKYPAGRPGGTAERATEDNIEKDLYDLIK